MSFVSFHNCVIKPVRKLWLFKLGWSGKYFETNANGTLNILELSRNSKCFERFVYAASSSCYGLASTPTSESHAINNEHPYALSKYIGETIVTYWSKIYNLPFTSIRIFNAYGPRVRTTGVYGAVFGVFFKQKLEGHPLTVVGDGNQSRDFLYVEDVCNAFLMSASSKKSINEIYNLGFGNPKTINELVKILDSKKVSLPDRPGEPRVTHADISKISSEDFCLSSYFGCVTLRHVMIGFREKMKNRYQ